MLKEREAARRGARRSAPPRPAAPARGCRASRRDRRARRSSARRPGSAGRQMPWKPSQPAITSQCELALLAVRAVADERACRRRGRARSRPCASNRISPPAGETGGDEVLHHLVLAIDGHAAPAGELGEIDAVALALEAQLDAVMDEPLALHALADARSRSGGRAPIARCTPARMRSSTYCARARLEDHELDALEMQKMREHQSGRPGSDDPDLGAHAELASDASLRPRRTRSRSRPAGGCRRCRSARRPGAR